MLIQHLGLSKNIEGIVINPFDKSPELLQVNPLGKIPVLVINAQESLFNSPLICRYLLQLNTDGQQAKIQDNCKMYRWEALADGLSDSIYNLIMERFKRPKNEQSPQWIEKWTKEIKVVLTYVNKNIDELDSKVNLAHFALASATGYLDFRLNNLLYEKNENNLFAYPNLLSWFEVFSKNQYMQTTKPY
jgi:glutathione S-transferase